MLQKVTAEKKDMDIELSEKVSFYMALGSIKLFDVLAYNV